MVVISKNITMCTSFWKKATGLMFTRSKKDFAYIFTFDHPRILSITMMFVFYPIDILFLENGKIVEIAKNVQPFSLYVPKKKADAFIELPMKKAKKSWLGKKISWNSRILEMLDE